MDSACPLVLFVRQVLSVPLHELDLLFGTLQDKVQPQLMLVVLRFHIDFHVVDELDDRGLHSDASRLNVVLGSHLVALGHEFLHDGVDLGGLDEAVFTPVLRGSFGWVHGSSSRQALALDEGVDVLIEVSPAWVPDESNLTLLVDEGADWDRSDSEVGEGSALWVLNVVVVESGHFLLVHESLLLFLVNIDAEGHSSYLTGPLLVVCSHHLLHGSHWHVAVLAPGCPEVDHHDLVLFVLELGNGDSGVLGGSLDLSEFGTDLCPAEDVQIDSAEPLDGLSYVGVGSSAPGNVFLREDTGDSELRDLLSLLVGQIHSVGVRNHWGLEVLGVSEGGVGISKGVEDFALVLSIQISPLLAVSLGSSLATSSSSSTSATSGHATLGSHAAALSGWHTSSGLEWASSSSTGSWEHGWVQTLGLSLHPDLLSDSKGLRLGKLSLGPVGRLPPDHGSHLKKSRGWSLLWSVVWGGEVLLSHSLLDLGGLLGLGTWDSSLGFLTNNVKIWVIMLGLFDVRILIFFKRLYSFF